MEIIDGLLTAIDGLLDNPEIDLGTDGEPFLAGVVRPTLQHLRNVLMRVPESDAERIFLRGRATEIVEISNNSGELMVKEFFAGFGGTVTFLAEYEDAITGLEHLISG